MSATSHFLHCALSRSTDQERNILFVFSRVYCSQNMFLILGSGENLSFVLYYEFCYIRVDNALASMGSDTHTMVEDGGW